MELSPMPPQEIPEALRWKNAYWGRKWFNPTSITRAWNDDNPRDLRERWVGSFNRFTTHDLEHIIRPGFQGFSAPARQTQQRALGKSANPAQWCGC